MDEGQKKKLFWIIILLSAGIICLNGIFTDVYLGDESHHYRFTQNIFTTGKRIPFDPLYDSGNPPGFFNNDPPLWHLGLAFLWKILGGANQITAQVYHVFFYIILILVTSALTKETFGEGEKWLPALIIATVPMVVSFSTLLYMDIPMTALVTLSFYLILKKKYFIAGILSGLAYLTKLNSGFLFPGFLITIFLNERKRFSSVIKGCVFYIIPIIIIYLYDLNWRTHNIPSKMNISGIQNIKHRVSVIIFGLNIREYLNSYLSNPFDLIKYFGLVFLFLFFLYFFQFRRKIKRDGILLVPVASYFILFFIFFGINSDIRYLMPILPFLVALFTPNIISLGRNWKIILIIICLFQFISTVFYVNQKRKIPNSIKEGFEFIQKNVPKEALILYPEENLLIYTQRRMIWSAFTVYRSGKRFSLDLLFWSNSLKEMNEVLKINQVSHILIKKSRIYDDQKDRHFGGYPKSFVEKLPHLDGWRKVFENSELALWKRVEL